VNSEVPAVTLLPLIRADLPRLNDIAAEFEEILLSGRITNFGPHVEAFEREAAVYLGVPTATTSSATAGLILTLQAMALPAGSRVLIPSFSFVATAQAVRYAGSIPTFVEVREDGNLSPSDLEAELGRRDDVSAVIAVHMYGLPCDIEAIDAVIRRASARTGRRIRLVYDAAHAFGSEWNGVHVGGFGDAEVFSLSVTKVLTSVEGGMVASRDEAILRHVRKARNYGIESNYNAQYPGLNGKMSEFHAIVGRHNLRRLPELMVSRQRKSAHYAALVHQKTSCRVMASRADCVSTFKDFTVVVPSHLKVERDRMMATIATRGVETRAYFYPPIHEQDYFRPFADRPLPVTEDLARRVITLPFYSSITEAEMALGVDALAAAEADAAAQVSAGALSGAGAGRLNRQGAV
jgi:dTDP-4-amino-4,6-dideoxygalactose transaminase